LLPFLNLIVRAISSRIVGCGMHRKAIGYILDHRGTIAGACPLDCFLCGYIDGKQIVAVNLNAGNPVSGAFLGQSLGRRLMASGHRDRPLVVLTDEDGWCPEYAGKAEGLVKVALRCGAITKKDHRYIVSTAVSNGISQPHRVWYLRCDRNRVGQIVSILWDTVSLHIATVIDKDAFERSPTVDFGSGFAESRYEPIGIAQGSHSADLCRFLAAHGRKGTNAPLAL